ncbi:MAG: sigma-70 family RNA polymerase sigma factor [Luteolibacter sp.]
MAAPFPNTPLNLLSKLKHSDSEKIWEISWKRFLELYHEPLKVCAQALYRSHTGGQIPSQQFIEDVVADVVAGFFRKDGERYDPSKGRLRTYLRLITNRRLIDLLRAQMPASQRDLDPEMLDSLQTESPQENDAFQRSLLATLLEELRSSIPLRQFEIFERVKLKQQKPAYVAEDLGLERAMVDRYIHKAMKKLREIASQPEYQ